MEKVVNFLTVVGALTFSFIAGFAAAAKGLEMMGAAGQKIRGAFDKGTAAGQGALGNRKETNAFAVRRQLKKADKQEQRTLKGAEAVSNGLLRGSTVNRWGRRVLPKGVKARGERTRTKAQSYALKQEMESLGSLNAQHMQALAMSGGTGVRDVDNALNTLIDEGVVDGNDAGAVTRARAELDQTAAALRSRGTDLGGSNTRQAIGELGADHGMYLSSYGNWFSGEAQRSLGNNSYGAAVAGGVAAQWGRTARGKGQFSHSLNRLGTFTQASVSDLGAVNQRMARDIQENFLAPTQGANESAQAFAARQANGQALFERAAQLHAQAEVAINSGDKEYNQDYQDGIAAGHAQLQGMFDDPATGQNRFLQAVAQRRAEIETQGRATTSL